MKEADVDPLVLAGADLLVVDDVVAGGAVAALVEFELVSAQSCNGKEKRLFNKTCHGLRILVTKNISFFSAICVRDLTLRDSFAYRISFIRDKPVF